MFYVQMQSKGAGGGDPKAMKVLQDKLERSNQEKQDLNAQIKGLKADLKDASSSGRGGGGGDPVSPKWFSNCDLKCDVCHEK